jgi:hypothetical protein
MATLAPGGLGSVVGPVNLQTAQTGNADSTNVLDRAGKRGPAILVINATAGATPTVTVNILGSVDGTNFFNVDYATMAAPETPAIAALTLTTTAVTHLNLRDQAWRFLKLNMSANTNMTLTSDVYL